MPNEPDISDRLFNEFELNEFIKILKEGPSYIRENVMCYYYYNNSNCTKCPKYNFCKLKH